MAEKKVIVLQDGAHGPAEVGDTIPVSSLPLSAEPDNALVIKPDGLFANTPDMEGYRRNVAELGNSVHLLEAQMQTQEAVTDLSRLSADYNTHSATIAEALNHVMAMAKESSVTRRKTPENFDLQIERTPATGMQVVRVTGTTSNTTSVSYDIDWSTHPFANTAYLFAGAHSNTGTLLQSPPVTHTTTGARINVRQPGPFIVEFRGYY